jgi:hypothetical protein
MDPSSANKQLVQPYVASLLGPVVTCARDSNVLPLKVAAERAFFALFKMDYEGTTLMDVLPFPVGKGYSNVIGNAGECRSGVEEECTGI